MKVFDLVWGKTEVVDEDILAILKHPAMERIKKIWISSYGYLFNLQRSSTRFEHSLGVYLLLRRFKASKREQLAGLIHDVSHTALSHLSTYAIQGKYTGEEFHELMQKKFILDSGLGDLLESLGYGSDELLHASSFALLENDLPDICADRLDYALRDGLHLQILSRQQADQIIHGLTVKDGEFMFSDENSAFLYSINFYLLNLMFYGSPAEAHFNNDFGALVNYSIKGGVLKEVDWFSDDIYLLGKLKKSKNVRIQKWLGNYNQKLVVYEDSENPDKVFPKKIRIVDPKILTNARIRRLSEINGVYNKLITNYKETHKEHSLPVKIVYKD
jgi:hypothetical protein